MTNFGSRPVPVPLGTVVVASGPLRDGLLPADTTAWIIPAGHRFPGVEAPEATSSALRVLAELAARRPLPGPMCHSPRRSRFEHGHTCRWPGLAGRVRTLVQPSMLVTIGHSVNVASITSRRAGLAGRLGDSYQALPGRLPFSWPGSGAWRRVRVPQPPYTGAVYRGMCATSPNTTAPPASRRVLAATRQTVNVASIARRRPEQAGRLGDSGKMPLFGVTFIE